MTLIGPEALRDRLGEPGLRIVDVRWRRDEPGHGRRRYAEGHLPGAVFADLDVDLTGGGDGRHPLPDPATFLARMEALGLDADRPVVVYDDAGGLAAARLWWMLDDLGHPDVALLDGGLPAWVASGGALVRQRPAHPRGRLALRRRWTRTIDRDALAARLGAVTLLDARAAERYRGEVEPIDRVPGHIPTAVSLPASGSLAPDGRFLDAAVLRARIGPLRGEVVVSCGSGVHACHDALALRLAGHPAPTLYPGSYSDWSAAGFPVATGPEPGDPPGRADEDL